MRCVSLRYTPEMSKKVREQNAAPLEAILTIGQDRSGLDRALNLIGLTLFAGTGAAAVAVLFLVRWSVRSGLAPLDELGVVVAEIDAAKLGRRLPGERMPAELRPITDRLNELLARLESSFERERRFSTSAAHELRTPLAELRSLAEVNLTTPATTAEATESWNDVLASTLRMQSLSTSLLALATAANPANALAPERVALSEILQTVWDSHRALAAKRRITPTLQPTDRYVNADRTLLMNVLGNLLGNAIEHSPEGATVSVSTAASASATKVLIRNPAPGLCADDIPQMFERFWKKDAARADGRHHGLGLSIASELSALLDGNLTAQLLDGEIEFSLELPTL